ncbi:hypothetical protein [Chitinimonas taiwanensis]|uniref:Uncharacterized protein n=1 Tax=Chitinimonas taiwanensis DSM 18899 TaxID=1121279 RepID=A0A1K2HMB3_9NEIS|nr:hypothetical protein [Chitinimonas taiwanensis]SFZ77394.1 hypothetical protein SAMN02745887_02398 [Chitinimonas taiwanensis DSM 18899]
MKMQTRLIFNSFLALLCVITFAKEDGSRVWIERPWEYRFILLIGDPASFSAKSELGKRILATVDPSEPQIIQSILPDATIIRTDSPNALLEMDKAVAFQLIRFNEQGEVISPYHWTQKLSGKINRIRSLILAPGNAPADLQFHLGYWYTGISSEESAYIPAICSMGDMERRYKPGFKAAYTHGNFGCREWGYYLQNDQFPYIDVTSYQWEDDYDKPTNKKGEYPQMLVARILPVIGWGRFDVPSKPVIGKQIDTWVCLHECPDSEAPGIIPDIKAWAAKRGWPVPLPPEKMPLFPDREYQRGEFID